jgi:radical SAM superfamily enzyme YgiQ (UPF0313 family)
MHPTVLSEEVLKDSNVDIVVRGEGEEILNILYQRIKNNEDYKDIEGISFYENGKIIHNESAPLPDLEKIQGFPYNLFEKYTGKYELGFISSSRGCPYNCIFCSQRCISGRNYRFISSDIVIQDLEKLIFKYNRTYITFVDDSFTINKKRVFELCDLIQKKGFHKKVQFSGI